MKTVLIPLEGHDEIAAELEVAVQLATRFGSHIEGLLLNPDLGLLLSADAIGASVISEVDLRRDPERVRELSDRFEGFMRARGVRPGGTAGEGPSYAWREATAVDASVGSRSRVFDVTILGRPGAVRGGSRTSTFEAALFESGRPVLITPPDPPSEFGRKIMIAWNGSTETARTIGLAKPLLRDAADIAVVAVEGSGVPGPTGADVVDYLRHQGIAARSLSVNRGSQSVGEALLSTAADIGSDLIIKGAFTQSRLRQLIFGGATRHLITQADLPVLMAH